jgi:hypothetical protein
MKHELVLLAVVLCVSTCNSNDLIVGSIYQATLIWVGKVDYMFIPFMKRNKDIFYADPAQQVIKVSGKLL